MTAESEGPALLVRTMLLVLALGVAIILIIIFVPKAPGWLNNSIRSAINAIKIISV